MNGEKWNEEKARAFPKMANDRQVNLTFAMSAMSRSACANTSSHTSGGKNRRRLDEDSGFRTLE